tara:strand:- start:775 stop:1518 length:744 start_codon:yes stop_codon:yes gene_type:complete
MNICIIIASLMFLTLMICIFYNHKNNNTTNYINKNIKDALYYLDNNLNNTSNIQKIPKNKENKLKGGNTIENMKNIKQKLEQSIEQKNNKDNSLKLQEDLDNIIQLKDESTLKTELIKDFKDKYKNNKFIDINTLFINNDNINNKYLNRDIILSDKNISEATNRLDILNQNKLNTRKIIKPYEPLCSVDNNPDFNNNNNFSYKNQEISDRKKQENEYKELQLDLEDKETTLEPYGTHDFDSFSIFNC